MGVKRVVGFSGGIDSQATLGVVLDEFGPDDVIALHSPTGGFEQPITEEFVVAFSRDHFPVRVVEATEEDFGDELGAKNHDLAARRDDLLEPGQPITYADVVDVYGYFPIRKAPFCRKHLKLFPQRRWVAENVRGPWEMYCGVRRDESDSRRDTPDRVERDQFWAAPVNYPVAAWDKQGCFDFVRARGWPVNPLYTMGFDRVGCMICVEANKDQIRTWAARFPEQVLLIAAWEDRVGKPFLKDRVPGEPDARIGRVVEWSRTARGGKQLDLPVVELEAERGQCSSRYGLCE